MDVYKIGVEIALSNSISSALSALSAQFLGVGRDAKKLEGMFGPNSAMVLGIAAAGAAMLAVSGKMLANGAELQKQIGQMKLLLSDYSSVGKDVATATQVSVQTPGTTVAENVKMLKLILPSVKNESEARKILPLIMPDAIATSRITGASVESIIEKGIKAEDLVGHIIDPKTNEFNAARLVAGFHAQMAVLIASGGNLHPDDMLGYARQNSTFAKLVDIPLKMWAAAFTPMMEAGGRSAGTATAALGQQFVAGRTSKSAVKHAIKLGLLDASKAHFLGAAAASVDAGGWKGEDLLNSGQFDKWFTDVFKPAARKNHKGPMTTADYLSELAKTVGRQNAGRMGALFLMNEAQIERDKAMVNTVASKDFYKDTMASDLGMNVNALSTSLQSLFSILGKDMVGPAISGIQALTAAIGQLTALAGAHPTAATLAGYGTASGGVLATLWAGMKTFSWLRCLGSGGTALAETAGAAGGSGAGAGVGVLGNLSKWLGGPMTALQYFATGNFPQSDEARAADKKTSASMHKFFDGFFSSPRGVDGHAGGRGAYSQPITVNPQIQATTNVTIDGKSVAAAILPMIIKQIGNLIPHPTSAPMFSGSNFPYSADSSMGNR